MYGFYPSFFVKVVYCIDWLDTKAYLHSWNKFYLIIVYDPLSYGCIWFANILLRISASEILTCYFFFCVLYLSGSGVKTRLFNFTKWVRNFSIFWSSLRRIGIKSSLRLWKNSPVKLFGPGFLFIWGFR